MCKRKRGGGKENDVCTLKRKLPTKIKILSFVYFDEIGFEEQIVKYLPNLVHIPVFLSFFLPLLYCFFFPPYKSHLNVSGWNHILSAQPVASGCLCLFVCSGWPWFTRDCSSLRVRDSHFGYVHIHSRSMASSKQRYFRRSNTQTYNESKEIFNVGIIRYHDFRCRVLNLYLQSRPTHLLLLCLLLHSSKLQKCPLSPCSYGLKHQSVEMRAIRVQIQLHLGILWIGRIRAPPVLPVCSRCGHICQKSRWLDGVRQGWRPRCTRAPGVWLVCGCRCLDLHPKAEQWSQRKH